MSLLIIAVCLAAGSLIGFMGGALGIGGGLIAIPALVLLMGMSQQLAQGTALIMVLPAITVAVRKYNQQARIDRRVAAAGAAGAVVFTWVGARLALGIESSVLRQSFAVFLFFVALFYVWQTWRAGRLAARRQRPEQASEQRSEHPLEKPAPSRPVPILTPRRASVLGMLCGTLGGFFGVGGAVLAVPIITTVFRLSQTTAQALALCMVIPGSTIALITYAWAGQANWMVGLPMAIGSLLFVPVGVRLAYKLPERKLRVCFALLLFATVALLVFES
ncbi:MULTISPECIES: sulfite exporter TauE/SafE family protein [Achromobacter]|uniref:Probable membrane transporter protein n=1 Tax=Achromobacter spanius TaxID=217203 RepID=A0ABY8GYP6_9BURK|nr:MULTISPECIES: sulfite exporter TauE/SafE family protein [Achromobacter]WAI86186.1 sulfite exporter TauE/SafE family protein [Achromobacter spanius]WEX96266.1 sulfite exporter TauE/SafE family protein [Achromobacter sp. SS2-2022]WFP10015.1 sulfite exporter TauE/SafE family protein [Achromobacter spanius]